MCAWRVPTDPIKYDDRDYHEEAAQEAGYPVEHGFTHIGLFLAWLIRHDIFGDRVVDAGDVERCATAVGLTSYLEGLRRLCDPGPATGSE